MNNRAGAKAIILSIRPCAVRDCLFMANTMRYLYASTASNAVFLRCIFDQWQFWKSGSCSLITDSCDVRNKSTISFDHEYCPLAWSSIPAPDSSNAAEIVIGVTASLVGVCLIVGAVVFFLMHGKLSCLRVDSSLDPSGLIEGELRT
jgi:hypothetical protein